MLPDVERNDAVGVTVSIEGDVASGSGAGLRAETVRFLIRRL